MLGFLAMGYQICVEGFRKLPWLMPNGFALLATQFYVGFYALYREQHKKKERKDAQLLVWWLSER